MAKQILNGRHRHYGQPGHGRHRHRGQNVIDHDLQKTTIVLVGNPNVGKSIFFNYLSGVYVDVSNFPGTTVEVLKGNYLSSPFDCDTEVYDTPGIYSVSSFNDEEKVARDIILNADIILNVVDAVHLERDLFLTQQLIDMGKRVVVALNMMDEAEKHNIHINIDLLSDLLGVPVIPTIAPKKIGFEQLDEALRNAWEGHQDPALHAQLHQMLTVVGAQEEALLILEGDEYIAARHGVSPGLERERIYIERRNRVNDIIQRVVTDTSTKTKMASRLGLWSVNPLSGIVILLAILYLTYLFIGKFVAKDLVDFTEHEIGNKKFEYYVKSFVSKYATANIKIEALNAQDQVIDTREFNFPDGTDAQPTLLKEMNDYIDGKRVNYTFTYSNPFIIIFFGEFGVFTMTVTYLVFLLLPLVLGFYLMLSILEDSGYLPRLATLVDRILRYVGLNGRAVIPIILGFGCVTMATITTRLLGTQREKTIATTILQLAIPCSAQLGVIAALLATAGLKATIIYSLIIFSFLVIVGSVLNRTLPGESSPLLIDLPPMRFPRLDNVMRKTGFKTYFFMKEATPWFFVGALAVGIMQVTGLLNVWQDLLAPLTTRWLQLPREAATAFVMGLVRRDFGAAGLYQLSLTCMQTVVALVTITLFVPCIASLIVMLKERGAKEGLLIWTGSWVLAFGIGGIVSQILV